jgi:uncharacterized protein (TIGR02099 family)
MTVFVTLLRRARTLLWTAFSILAISAAVLMGIGKLLIPYSDRYQPRLEAWLSEEFGQPVVLESFVGEWTAFGPRISLRGMKLLSPGPSGSHELPDAQAVVAIESAALDVRPLNLLIPGFPLYNFRVIGADFELLRRADGQFRLSGFGVSRGSTGQEGSALTELLRVGEVVLQDSSLVYRDEMYGVQLDFRDISGRLHLSGDELASEIRASLYDDRSGLVVGEMETVILLSLDDDQRPLGAEWHGSARELMLAAFQGRLPASPFMPLTGWFNAEFWGDWSVAEGHRVRGVADLTEARLVNEYQDLWLDRVNTRFQWQFSNPRSWTLHLSDFLFDDGSEPWTAPRLSMARNTAADLGLWISADNLPLGVPLRLARDVMSIYETPWPAFLPGAASGRVSELDLVLDAHWRVALVRGDVKQGGVSEWGRWPDLQGLTGRVEIGPDNGRLNLSGDQVLVRWPSMFREPLALAFPACTLELTWGVRWQAGIRDCSLMNADFAAHGEMMISGNTGRPFVDLNVEVTRGSVGQLDPYWPESVMSEAVKAWLRRGLVGGQIEHGRVSIYGDMDNFPFRDGQGRFEAVARVNKGKIDYLADWPDAREVSVVARFVGASMDLRGQVGNIAGVAVKEVKAAIADFREPVLMIDYRADSTVPGLLRFLQRTPLQKQVGADLSRFEFAGSAATSGRITLPFADRDKSLAVDGTVRLSGGRFSDPDSAITIGGIGGRLDYDEKGFRAPGLSAEYRNRPARLNLLADADGAERFRADLMGDFSLADVIPEFLHEGLVTLTRSEETCAWKMALIVAPPLGGVDSMPLLRVTSALEGVTLDLPAPLAKAPAELWPLNLEYPLSGTERILQLDLDNRIRLRLDLGEGAEAPSRAVLHAGGGRANLPPEGVFRIAGQTGTLDLDGWIGFIIDEAERGIGMGGLVLEPSELDVSELVLLDRVFPDVGLSFSVAGTDVQAAFDGQDIDGKVRFASGAGGSRSLAAEFERLALGEPLSEGVEMEMNPAELPAFHLYAHSLRYAGIELGETRIEAYPIANGFHFEKIDASSERLKLQASGDWLLDEGGHRSDFDIHVASESLGDFLQSLDIASPVQGGQTLVYLNAWWPGAPAAFALSRLNGEVEFSVVGGNISSASAGGGRLLGLLSVQALPKRLALDFRDVFDSGFTFDEAAGTFQMNNGMATTDNVLLRSSAANISVSGRTDLVAREYDQLLTIKPGVGNTLPIIGALAAGPGGAAAGLALQGLLQGQLAEATQVRYSVTGSWDDPKFETIAVERKDG